MYVITIVKYETYSFKFVFYLLRDNLLIYTYHSGFIPGDSTINKLLILHPQLCPANEENGISGNLLIDYLTIQPIVTNVLSSTTSLQTETQWSKFDSILRSWAPMYYQCCRYC